MAAPGRTIRDMEIEPLTPVIGAEVHGVELATLNDHSFADVEAALLTHQVLFFRDQEMELDQHKSLGLRFGPLHIHPSAPPGAPGHPEVLKVHADENTKRTAGDRWHSDVSCDAEPPMLSILRLHTLPESGGGDTLFSSMYAAYDALSPAMQEYLGGLSAEHDGGPNYRDRNRRVGYDDSGREYPRAEHPVIRTHPRTGRKALFVNSVFTTTAAWRAAGRGRCGAGVPLRPRRQAPVPVPLPLAAELRRHVGQPLRSAPRHVGLLSASALRLPCYGRRRPADLTDKQP